MRIDSAGNVGIGTSTLNSNKAVIEGGVAGSNSSTLALKTGSGANSKVADLAFYGTFVTPTSDQGQRRTADITSGFSTANWGTEYLAFGVGVGGTTNDAANVTSEKMRINSAGIVTMPYQPAFAAYDLQGGGLITVTASNISARFTTAPNNTGNHYSTSTGKFTAPVSGQYLFGWNLFSYNQSVTSASRLGLEVNGNNGAYPGIIEGQFVGVVGQSSILVELTAGDYVNLSNQGGSSVYYYASDSRHNRFWGYLIG
jgi:hypothetical protein